MVAAPFDTRFRIVILTALPEGKRLSWIDMNPHLSALSWTTDVGGYGGLNVGYKTPGMPQITSELKSPIEVPDLATVQVWTPSESGFLGFEGRVQEVNDVSGLRVSKFTAHGLGTADGAPGDDWFHVPPKAQGSQTVDDVNRSAADLLYRIVPAVTDILRMGDRDQITDPGGSYNPRQQAGRYLGQAIDQITKAGADGGQDIFYYVYEDRRIQLGIIEPPLDDEGRFLPDYMLSLDARVDWKRNGKKLVGACAVEYTPPGQAKQTTPVASVPGWSDSYGGLTRSLLIPTSAITLQQAMAIRNRYLRRYSVPMITGTVSIGPNDRKMENRLGQAVPYYMYRYGQWISISGTPYFITKTSIDASSQKASVTFVNVPLSLGDS